MRLRVLDSLDGWRRGTPPPVTAPLARFADRPVTLFRFAAGPTFREKASHIGIR